jgi:carbonic anhydrase
MPQTYSQILEKNQAWVARLNQEDPTYFSSLAVEHKPRFLFIGCSDARVPADLITQTSAGEMFVHRNIANLVVPTDNNVLAVLQYAVEALNVSDIIVCGHYGCGGVKASMGDRVAPPLVESWLSNIRTVARMHAQELESIPDLEARYKRLVELNVIEQVYNLSQTQVIKDAWEAGKTLRVHGCVYALNEGLLRDLGVTRSGLTQSEGATAGTWQSEVVSHNDATPVPVGH